MKAWLPLSFVGLVLSSACSGETGGADAPTGGVPGVGGAASSGGGASSIGGSSSASGGAASSGGTSTGSGGGSSGGSSSGGSSSGGGSSGGGTPSSGGQAATGGSGVGGSGDSGGSTGTGGLPGICGCEAASFLVCGVDGETYDAGCGEVCVPVDIACPGECPCDPNAGCGCTTSGPGFCDEGLLWECNGGEFDPMAPLDLGCEDTAMSAIRYCCSVFVTADDFCAP